MGEEKRNKIVAAVTINAVLLVVIILAVLIAQIIQISVLKRRKAELLTEYNRIVRQYEEGQDMLERLQTDEEYLKVVQQLAQMGVKVTPEGN